MCSGLAARGAAPVRGSAEQTLARRTEARCAAQVMAEEMAQEVFGSISLRIEAASRLSTRHEVVALLSEIRNATRPDVVDVLCTMLCCIAHRNRVTNVALLLECGAAEAVLNVICSTPKPPARLFTAAFSALSHMMDATEWRESTFDLAATEALKTLRGPLAKEQDVSEAACRFFCSSMLSNPNHAQKICNVDTAQALVTAMQRFPTCEKLQCSICTTLSYGAGISAANGSPVRHAIVAQGGFTAILANMSAFPDASRVLQCCCLALAQLIHRDAALQIQLVHLGGVDTISTALTHLEADVAVADSACFALESFDTSLNQVSSRAAAVALDAVLAALRAHAGHLDIQRHGISTLFRLMVHEAIQIRAEPILPVVLSGMKAFPNDMYLQSSACLAIGTGCFATAEFRTAAGAAGAEATLVQALRLCVADAAQLAVTAQRRSVSSIHVFQHAAVALSSLLGGSTAHQNQLVCAVHSGALSLLQAGKSKYDARHLFLSQLIEHLQQAAAEHAAEPPGCPTCAAMRADGRMCGRAGCLLRWRANGRNLPRCALCHRVAYCCPEHQREDWRASHKAECIARAAR